MTIVSRLAVNPRIFLASLAVGAVPLFHFIVFFPISIDDELAATRTDPSAWIAQDRWFAFLVELVFDQPVVPSLYYLVFLFLLALSFLAIVRSVGLEPSFTTVLAFGIVASYPSLWLLLSFAGNVLPLGFGLALSGLSLLLFTSALSNRAEESLLKFRSRQIWAFLASSFCLACSVGAYHSSALLFLVGIFGWVLAHQSSNRKNLEVMSIGMAVFLFSLGLWKFVSEIAIGLAKPPANQLEYISGYWRPEDFWGTPLSSALSFVEKAFSFYAVDESLFGRSANLGIVLFVATVACFLLMPTRARLTKVPALVLLVISPFLFFFVSGVSGVPIRSHVTVGFVLALLLLLALSTRLAVVKAGLVVLASIFILQLNQISAEYAAEERLAFEFNSSLASEIYHRMDYCGGEEAGLQLSIIGARPFSSVYATSPGSSSEGSFFGWYGPSPGRAGVFMGLIGYRDVTITALEELQLPVGLVDDMSVFPDRGSMVCYGGVNLLKLSR